MKRFQSPLLRFLRLRKQAEHMARLHVARLRSELDDVDMQLAAARDAAERRVSDAATRLRRPGASLLVQQALWDLQDAELHVTTLWTQRTVAAERLASAIGAYRDAQRARELLERAVDRDRQEHRRGQARAAAVDLQDWILRPKHSSISSTREGTRHA